MRKNIFFTVCLIALLSSQAFAQNTISRDETFKIIKQKGLVDTLTNNVKASQQIILANTVLDFMGDSIKSPKWDSWFFFN